jgi:hypothetical protein
LKNFEEKGKRDEELLADIVKRAMFKTLSDSGSTIGKEVVEMAEKHKDCDLGMGKAQTLE